MIPAQKRFAANGTTGPRIDDRLIDQLEFAILQRALQVMFELNPAIVTLGDRFGMPNDQPAPRLPCLVEREIGVSKQFLDGRAVAWSKRVANAGATNMPGNPRRKWFGQFRRNALRHKKSFAFAGAGKHHDKFVAANSRSLIGGPNH